LDLAAHAASTRLAARTRGRVGIHPRRNRCFHSSVGKVAAPNWGACRRLRRDWVSRLATAVRLILSSDVAASAEESAGRWTRRVSRTAVRGSLVWGLSQCSRGDPHSGPPREERPEVYHRGAVWVKVGTNRCTVARPARLGFAAQHIG